MFIFVSVCTKDDDCTNGHCKKDLGICGCNIGFVPSTTDARMCIPGGDFYFVSKRQSDTF